MWQSYSVYQSRRSIGCKQKQNIALTENTKTKRTHNRTRSGIIVETKVTTTTNQDSSYTHTTLPITGINYHTMIMCAFLRLFAVRFEHICILHRYMSAWLGSRDNSRALMHVPGGGGDATMYGQFTLAGTH